MIAIKKIKFLSPESMRQGFIDHEDPLADVDDATGYLRLKEQSEQLSAYANIFNEIPIYPNPTKAREILSREGYTHVRSTPQFEIWDNLKGIIAKLQVSGDQAVVHFDFQTLWVAPLILSGNRSPFNLANGDVVFSYSIFAEPGVLAMLRQVQPYVISPWRVKVWRHEEMGPLGYLQPMQDLTEFKPYIPAEENYSLKELMELSGETYEIVEADCYKTQSGGGTRLWFKPFQGAISFKVETKSQAQPWLKFYHLLADFAHANNCRLTERNSDELGLTGKLCCTSRDANQRSLKVQLVKGQPTILDYCDPRRPELPNF
jgi:hypothetical protein